MKKIYLFCSQGMSTSLLASSMQRCADEHFLPIEVSAHPHGKILEIVKLDRPDVILLGPQVKYLYVETLRKLKHSNIPIGLINEVDYGMMNGEKILKKAIILLKNKKKEKSQ